VFGLIGSSVSVVLDGWVSVAAVAERIGVSSTRVHTLIERGDLVGQLLDRDAKRKKWWIEEESVERYVAKRDAAGRDQGGGGALRTALEVSRAELARADRLEAELAVARRELDAALRGRDEQTLLAIALTDELNETRAELMAAMNAQMELLNARQAVLRRRTS
jgi:hypothetical protein